ncbi:Ubiquitin-specific protease 16 [Heracleum sosnowskyi]|uniref:ubiquitinyl hydrolase 1 n=1 Tax=Heracleum sosnowskyi TaxID=360622 RepID=A0AAD8N4R7_9APIA|nr:Ubiquitin-specific protease 16 [Heracleum sosnowskyi]
MLVRGALGFVSLGFVVVVVVLGVIWVVLRRKWRISVSRREEIKRLLVLAAEESARVEFEAKVEYSIIGESVEVVEEKEKKKAVQNQCALCFSPTKKLCSQCKAVYYCSGNCQIIHWRQIHKDECHQYAMFSKSNEDKLSSQKVYNKEDRVSHGDSYELDGRQHAKQVTTFPEKYTHVGTPDVLHGKGDIEGEVIAEDVESNSSDTSHPFDGSSESTTSSSEASLDASVYSMNDSDGLNGIQTIPGIPVKSETVYTNVDQNRSPFTEKSSFLEKSSIKFSQNKPVCSDGNCNCASCSSTGRSFGGSNDSLSDPATPSSGFWEGTIKSRRSRNDANDDCNRSSLSESCGDVILGSGSSLRVPTNLAKNNSPVHQGLKTKTLITDDGSTALGNKRHVNEAALSVKSCKDALNSRISTSKTSTSIHVDSLKSRETKSSPSSDYCAGPDAISKGHIVAQDIKNISNMPSLCSERSNKVGNDTIIPSRASRSQKVGTILCKDSDTGLTSSCGKDNDHKAKLSNADDGVHRVTTCSPQLPTDSANAKNGLKSTMLKVVDQLKASKVSRNYSMGVSSEALGKYSLKGLFPYEQFVKLYNWNKVEMKPCGLINCGNSCYANAVLQCLAFTPPITAYLLQRLHSKTCQTKGWCFTCEFESLIVKAKEGNTPLSPIRILSHIGNIGSHLNYGKEEDAHEFLRCAIDTMQSSCLKEATSKCSGSLNEETSLIGLTFGGYLRSKIKCMKCGGKSERQERIMDLAVEIDGNICTLEEALRKFTGTEILDGENKYKCSRCKSYEKAKKKLTIVEAPNVLTIALKRFQSGKFGKLSKSIKFPEVLNMTPFMSSTSDMSPIYRLYGVVVHLDIMNASFSGHYVCYVKNIQNKWFKIDDSSVNEVELESVLTKGAYMLLYARCSPRAPKFIRNSMVPHDPRKPKNLSLLSRSQSTGACGSPRTDHLNNHSGEGFFHDHPSYRRVCSTLDDDSSSDNSSSIFSEACSCSTESSTKDSTSTDDFFDQIFSDSGQNWNNSWWNSSDSDTSSSSPSPSPLYSKNIHCTSLDHYATRYNKGSLYAADHAEYAEDGHVWAKQPSKCSNVENVEGKGSAPILNPDKSKHCRKLDSNSNCSSCRETNLDRVGKPSLLNSVKSGLSLRKSSRG